MKTSRIHSACIATSILLSQSVAAQTPAASEPVPIAPIASTEYKGWSNAFKLGNKEIEVVIVPEIGRIVHLGRVGETNLLRLNEDLLGQNGLGDSGDDWPNFGGDWVWPVAQRHWPDFQDGHWPPSLLLDGTPWAGRAWRTEDGSRHCLVTRDFGTPLHVRVTRTIRLDPTNAQIAVRQRIERLEESPIPVTLWHLTQVRGAEHIVIPVESDSRFDGGVRPVMFDFPEEGVLSPCAETVVYHTQVGGEHKLGSDSPRAWLAAHIGDTVVIARISPGDAEGPYPDGGCTVQLYANEELGYAEMETLSVERYLAPGEQIDNTLRISVHRLETEPETPCDMARTVQRMLGELPPLSEPDESDGEATEPAERKAESDLQ